MKRFLPRPFFLLVLTAALWLPRAVASADAGCAQIVERYRGLLVSGYAPTAQASAGWDATDASKWIATLGADSRWPDIDYENRAGGAWQTLVHLRRVRILSREISRPASPLSNDAAAEQIILRALDHWTQQRYQNPNWWQNQIGVPQVMRDIIVLLGDRLTGDRRAGAMAVLKQLKLMDAGIGANTVWSAELAMMAAALEDDTAALAHASALVAGEITQGGAQGIQDDFSFHQHGARLQQFHYGASFFQDTVRIAWLLRGTPWAISEEKVALLADFADRGNFWMSRGSVTVPGTLDRAVSRPGALAAAGIGAELALLADVLPERRNELGVMARVHASGRPPHSGFRAFPRSDFAVSHQSTASFFLKTISTRTEVTETLLRENRRGRKLNWGDHYVLTERSNYVDLPPVWNWELLPGVTSAPDVDSIQGRAFVGAVSAGGYGNTGAVAMDYATGQGEVTTLTARKFWAVRGGTVVGLIGALTRTGSGEPVRTALDQRRLRGAVTIADADGVNVLAPGQHTRSGVRWIHHDGLLYVPLGTQPVSFSLGPVTGSWNDVNLNYSTDPVTESIFLATLEHGNAPASAASGFVILPCDTPARAKKLMKKPGWSVWRNDADVQAVRFGDDVWLAAFYVAGKISTWRGVEVSVDAPCLLFHEHGELRASDPTHAGRTIRVRVGHKDYAIVCPAGGKTSEPVRL
ncbi:MAG: polysaccharide lyase beta-sandwich domain-containing protein [Magnetospirillum sp.]|nr:polysaccharide lyase beta-sandwich domain-containing protein [Magnetospirillum sp.]